MEELECFYWEGHPSEMARYLNGLFRQGWKPVGGIHVIEMPTDHGYRPPLVRAGVIAVCSKIKSTTGPKST